MGIHTDIGECPNCGKEMEVGMSNKPFDAVWGFCLNCGFTYETITKYLSLEDLNKERDDVNLDALKKLPKQKAI